MSHAKEKEIPPTPLQRFEDAGLQTKLTAQSQEADILPVQENDLWVIRYRFAPTAGEQVFRGRTLENLVSALVRSNIHASRELRRLKHYLQDSANDQDNLWLSSFSI
jgi:hypothetical protein